MKLVEVQATKEFASTFLNDIFFKMAVNRVLDAAPAAEAVTVDQYKALLEKYNNLRENFVDYVCSGVQNVAPYCLNKCEECVDKWGYCKQYSDYCKGFNPAEVILMDGDGNG